MEGLALSRPSGKSPSAAIQLGCKANENEARSIWQGARLNHMAGHGYISRSQIVSLFRASRTAVRLYFVSALHGVLGR